MKKILVFSSDISSCATIEETLKNIYLVQCATDLSDAIEHLKQKRFDAVIIDNDLPSTNGIESFKAIKGIVPRVRAIMISNAADISEAVTASKIGVLDFLTKPIQKDKLIDSIEKISADKSIPGALVRPRTNGEWLEGFGNALQELFLKLEEICSGDQDVLLVGGFGIPSEYIARMIHENSLNRKRRFVEIHLVSFEKESSEAMFWPTIQEVLFDFAPDLRSQSEACGTLYLASFDSLPTHFQHSILEYLKNRFGTKIDKTIRIILGVNSNSTIAKYDAGKELENFSRASVPELKERREDLPLITDAYIKRFSDKYCKNTKGISMEVLNFFMLYDWPGNYAELEDILSSAVLKSLNKDYLGFVDFSLDFKMLLSSVLKTSLLKGDWSLSSSQDIFQQQLISVVLHYAGSDVETAAKFLDIPKTTLSDRIKTLGIKI